MESNESTREMIHILEIVQESLTGLDLEPQRDIVNLLYRSFYALRGNAKLSGLDNVAELSQMLGHIMLLIRSSKISITTDIISAINNSADLLYRSVSEEGNINIDSEIKSMIESCKTIISSADTASGHDKDANSQFLTGLENRKVDDDVISNISVGGGGITLELTDQYNNSASPKDENSCMLPTNSLRPLRILIVEDEFTSRQLLLAALGKYGECHIAKDGLEAVQAVKMALETDPSSYYDLICMDVQMPNMDGTEASVEIRELERQNAASIAKECIIIMISCVEDPKVIMKSCYKCGANHYFVKPIDLKQMTHQLIKLGLIADNNPFGTS